MEGVKKNLGKNPKIGKNMVGGCIFDYIGKIQRTFHGFFPDPPVITVHNHITFSLSEWIFTILIKISYFLAKK